MHKRNAFLAVAALCVAFVAAAQADGKAKAMVCTACHGPDGNSSNPLWPNLAAQNPSYIVAPLKAFKAGKDRPDLLGNGTPWPAPAGK